MAENAPIQIPIEPDVRPTEDAVLSAPAIANTVRISHDPYGMTLAFFAIPADFAELPEARAQMKALGKPVPGQPVKVTLHLPTVAKVWVPAELVPPVLELLSRQYSQWLEQKPLSQKGGDPGARH